MVQVFPHVCVLGRGEAFLDSHSKIQSCSRITVPDPSEEYLSLIDGDLLLHESV